MTILQRYKYQLYCLIISIFPGVIVQHFSSLTATKWIRDLFFRPKGVSEIYEKKIKYHYYNLSILCPLQILVRAEKKGIEPSLSRMIMNELSEGDNCIDIGASYGFISLIMAKQVGFNGNVFSFEANPEIFKVLSKNISNNNLQKVCTMENCFISDKNYIGEKTLDKLFNDYENRITLIKIDTDGSDYDCILGAEKLIIKDGPIIIVETNQNGQEIYEKLQGLNYQYFYNQHYNIATSSSIPPNLIASIQPLQTHIK